MDRLLHRAVVIDITGESYRMRDHQARTGNIRRAVPDAHAMTGMNNFDRAELAETLQFLTDWIDGGRGGLHYSLTDFIGEPTYNIAHLHSTLTRFTDLLRPPPT